MATADQQNALKDAMERAKQIAAKLQQQKKAGAATDSSVAGDESRKRGLRALMDPNVEPDAKKNISGGNHTDPKSIAQQVANNLVQRAGFGFQQVDEVSIPNKLVGLVIGRGGEMINKLQSESGAKVQVAPDPTPDMAGIVSERRITISGDAQSVAKAKTLIDEIRNGQKIPERLMVGTLPGEFSIEMNIAKRKVGLVIGKGGETIKSLQERAGCKMVLFQDGPYADTPEKPLRISGEQSAVMYGKQLVQDLLTSKELEGITTQKENYKELEVPKDAIGLIIGAKGANIQQIQQETGCRLQFKNEMEGTTKTAMLTGNPQQIAAAETKITEIINSNLGSRGRKWVASESKQVNGVGTADGHIEMIVEVPANKCGLVIGKGGETIKYIHDESQVNIEINRDIQDSSPVRVFEVRGTQEMIDKAVEIIREKTMDESIVARPLPGNQPPQNHDQWGSQANGVITPQQHQGHQWGQQHQQPPAPQQQRQQQWSEHPQQQHEYKAEQRTPWEQHSYDQTPRDQQGSWNQQPQRDPERDQPRPQWETKQQQQWDRSHHAPQDQQSWKTQEQPQQAQTVHPQQDNPVSDPNTAAVRAQAETPVSESQPDYSAAWAEYYERQRQQQQQHLQHHGQHQQRPEHSHQQHGHQQHEQQQHGQQQHGHLQQHEQHQHGQQHQQHQQHEHQQHRQHQQHQQQYGQHQHEYQQYEQQQRGHTQHEQQQPGKPQHGQQQYGQQEQQHERQQYGQQQHRQQHELQQQHAPQQHRQHEQLQQREQQQQHAHSQHDHYQQRVIQRDGGSQTPPSSGYHPQTQPTDYQSKFEDYYKSIGQRPPQ